MSIANRNLRAGTKLIARYKGKEYTCEVAKTKDGLVYRLKDGKEFKSPSSAGSAVMDGNACNGWHFWSIRGCGEETSKGARQETQGRARVRTRRRPEVELRDHSDRPARACPPIGSRFIARVFSTGEWPHWRRSLQSVPDAHKPLLLKYACGLREHF